MGELDELNGEIAEAIADRPKLGQDVARLRTAVASMQELLRDTGDSLAGATVDEIAIVRHDLRMHLATFKGYVELLVEELQDEGEFEPSRLQTFEDARTMSNEMLAVISALRFDPA